MRALVNALAGAAADSARAGKQRKLGKLTLTVEKVVDGAAHISLSTKDFAVDWKKIDTDSWEVVLFSK